MIVFNRFETQAIKDIEIDSKIQCDNYESVGVVTGIAETWLRLTQSMGTRKKCKSTAFALLQQTTPHPQIRYNQDLFYKTQ
jgi:hypothetical protein